MDKAIIENPELQHISPDLRYLAVPIDTFQPDDKNAMKHDVDNLSSIADSFNQFGQRKPLVVNRRTMKCEAGSGGYLAAATLLGWKWIAVSWEDDDDLTAEMYGVADNAVASDQWQTKRLQEIIDKAKEAGQDVPGVNDEWLADVLARAGVNGNESAGRDTPPAVDRAEELQKVWQVKPGDVWQLGEHRLVCGDCADKAVVEAVLQGETPRLMVTDPPYGVNYDPNWRNEAAEKGFLSYAERRTGIVHNDDRVDWSDAYLLFPGDVAYTWSPPGDHVILTGIALQKAGFEIRNQIMWRKPHFPISRGHYTYQHEPCWYGVRKGKKSYWIGNHKASTVWDISLDKNVEGGHSTQKPLECMARPIANHEGDVYEPFCGSGTTVIAAHNLNRRCFAIELAPEYCSIILQRFLDHTGIEPRRIQ